MLRRTIIVIAAITIFMSVTALAAPPKTGCNKFNFTGTFLSPNEQDVFGDGNIHKFVLQLTLNSDGTANQFWTGLPDYIINAGTGSPQIGSWTCRTDGKLVIVWIQGTYVPVYPSDDPLNITSQDVKLWRHNRTTYLFTVDDDNTVTRVQSRNRSYLPTEDPSNAAGGTLGTISNATVTYKRLAASDADLLAP
jgi:hypothetical protein